MIRPPEIVVQSVKGVALAAGAGAGILWYPEYGAWVALGIIALAFLDALAVSMWRRGEGSRSRALGTPAAPSDATPATATRIDD